MEIAVYVHTKKLDEKDQRKSFSGASLSMKKFLLENVEKSKLAVVIFVHCIQ